MKEYIIYTHQSPEVATVDDFQADPLSVAKSMKVEEILSYKGDTGVANIQRIFDRYNDSEKKEFEDSNTSPTGNISLTYIVKGVEKSFKVDTSSLKLTDLKVNTKMLIPKIKVNKEPLVTQSNQVFETVDSAAFVADQLDQLQKDPDYTQVFKPKDAINGVAKEMYPNMKVWIWCRALSKDLGAGVPDNRTELDGTLIDVTQFVTQCSTSTAGQGGDFSLEFPAITCEPDSEVGWRMRQDLLANHNTLSGIDYTYEDLLTRDGMRSQFYFHNIIQENDLVFIRFEVLKKETLRRESNEYIVDPSKIPTNTFDMIGLVDGTTINTNPDSNEISVNVSGRDMMKLFIEDGCYVFPDSFGEDQFVKNQETDHLMKRLYSTGGLELLSAYTKRPIDFSVLFTVNQMANMGVVPDKLFEAYGDRRSTFYSLKSESKPQSVEGKMMNGVWQIIKFVFDENIAIRRVVDSSISFAQGSLINYINKVVQDPWCEFYGDTYGDEFVFVTRQKPFAKEGFMSLLKQVEYPSADNPNPWGNIREEDVVSENLSFYTGDVYSWYRLNPQAQLNGAGSSSSTAFVPAVYFSRYADIWGSKPYDIVSNYVNYISYVGDKSDENLGYFDQQTVHDLKFLIDSTCYLPFTRVGSITVNGDRRYKKGMVIRHLGTGEAYYVDSVVQNYSINAGGVDRTTTLNVSRGMVEKHLYDTSDDGFGDNPTYWNIIDTSVEKAYSQARKDSSLDITKLNVNISRNWKVRDEVFNFFLKRSQFGNTNSSVLFTVDPSFGSGTSNIV